MVEVGIFVLTVLWMGATALSGIGVEHYEHKLNLHDNAIIKIWTFFTGLSFIGCLIYACTQPIFWGIVILCAIGTFTLWISMGVYDFIKAVQNKRFEDEQEN